MSLFARAAPWWGDLTQVSKRRQLLEAIYDFLEIWTPRSERGRDWQAVRAHSLLATRDAGLTEDIVGAACSYGDLVRGLYHAYARLHDRPYAADKSALFAPASLTSLSRHLAELKIIHVIRDGRDVCLSWRKTWFGPATLPYGALVWADHVAHNRAWGRRHPESYCEVQFEDVLQDTEAVLTRVAAFLDVALIPPEARGQSALAAALATGGTHPLINGEIARGNREKWRTEMSPRDCARFERVAGTTLVACGYPLRDGGDPSPPVPAWRRGLIRFRGQCSAQRWRVHLKGMLPVALRVAQWTRLPLVRLLNGPPVPAHHADTL